MRALACLVLIVGLAGCSLVGQQYELPPDTSPLTKAYAVRAEWNSIKHVAVDYVELPFCGDEGVVGACADPAVVVEIDRVTTVVDAQIELIFSQIEAGSPPGDVQVSIDLARAGLRQVCVFLPSCTATGG